MFKIKYSHYYYYYFFLLENVPEERTEKKISMHIMEGGGVVGLSTSFYGRKFTSFVSFLSATLTLAAQQTVLLF